MKAEPPYYDTSLCLRLTGVSRSTWWRWVHKGALPQPAKTIGLYTWFKKDEVEAVVRGVRQYGSLDKWRKAKTEKDKEVKK